MPDYRPLLPWFGVFLLGLYFVTLVNRSGHLPSWDRGFLPFGSSLLPRSNILIGAGEPIPQLTISVSPIMAG